MIKDVMIRNMPKKLWRRVRVAAVKQNVTVSKWLTVAIKAQLEREDLK